MEVAGADEAGLDRLRAEIRSRTSGPYLITVTFGCRPHCGTVAVVGDGPDGQLAVRPVPGTWDGAEAADHRQVSLLWPPAEPGGYSLIADGSGTRGQTGGDPALLVTVSRAVLHRPGTAPAGSASSSSSSSSCGSDCIPLIG